MISQNRCSSNANRKILEFSYFIVLLIKLLLKIFIVFFFNAVAISLFIKVMTGESCNSFTVHCCSCCGEKLIVVQRCNSYLIQLLIHNKTQYHQDVNY